MRQVVIVDEQNNEVGLMEIVAAHTNGGTLHRAFSVYVFSPDGAKICIQRRSGKKMLWPHIWANTCCSHPFPGEKTDAAAVRRLPEECGISCPLEEATHFVYRADDPSGAGTEHEYLAIYRGTYEGDLVPNPDEIEEWRWVDVELLKEEMRATPLAFAPWFHLGLKALTGE